MTSGCDRTEPSHLRQRLSDLGRRLDAAGTELTAERRRRFALAAERLRALQPAPAGEPQSPADPEDFARSAIYAICSASVTRAVAERAFERCRRAVETGGSVRGGFRHPSKAAAIDSIWRERERLFRDYAAAQDKLAFIGSLPWIGAATKRRLARRLGLGDAPARSERRALSPARAARL